MESINLIPNLEQLPGTNRKYSFEEVLGESKRLRTNIGVIEGAIAAEIGLEYVFNSFNVDDAIEQGYSLAYTKLSKEKELYEKLLEEDPSGIEGLLSGIKGKVFEINLEKQLEDQFTGYDFSIAESPTQTGWDLTGKSPDGEQIFVQAKMKGAYSASEIKEKMLDNPDLYFATSTEIKEKILKDSPELANRFVDVKTSNMEFTAEIKAGVEQFLKNHGIDIPDEIGDILPYVGEIIAGIKLLIELAHVNRDFSKIEVSEKRKIQGLRAIMAFSRFGINSVMAFGGGAAGGAIGGTVSSPAGGIGAPIGALLGSISGLGAGVYINKKIKPHLSELTLGLMGLTDDELFYLRNKGPIDDLGERYYSNQVNWT